MLGLGSLVPRVLGVFHIGPEFLADRMAAESQASQREPRLAPYLHPHWCRLYMESFLYCLDSRVTRRASTLVGYPLAIHCAVESVIPQSLLRIYAKTDALANLPKFHIRREVTNGMAVDSSVEGPGVIRSPQVGILRIPTRVFIKKKEGSK